MEHNCRSRSATPELAAHCEHPRHLNAMSEETSTLLRRRAGTESVAEASDKRLESFKTSFSASVSGLHSRSKSTDSVKHYCAEGKRSSRWTPQSRTLLCVFALCALLLRIYRIAEPRQVVFDEVHFGGFASHYLKGTYFFDVHPPLGKLIIAGIGHLSGYKGTFAFKEIGDAYSEDPTIPYVEMRTAMAVFGTGSVAFAFATLIEMGFSPLAASIAGVFLVFGINNALVTQSKFILLDAMMLFFIFGAVLCWTKFRQMRHVPFSVKWWLHLHLTGLFIAGTVGVKLVGLFTVALIAFACLADLWELSDWRRQMPNRTLWRHLFARVFALAVVPVLLYLSFYHVHFRLLVHSGPGDGHMSTEFQQTLLGNKMHVDGRAVYYGQTVRIQNKSERVFLHSHAHRIPLNHLDGKVSSQGQQVNGYPVEDDNNLWILRRVVEAEQKDNPAELDAHGRRPVRMGDRVQICHRDTDRCMMTHDVASPLTRTNMEITMHEEGVTGVLPMTVWRLERIDESTVEQNAPVRSLGTAFRLVNELSKVQLMNYGKSLPPWGFGQRELNGCRKTDADVRKHWMIADVLNERTPEEEAERTELMKKTGKMPFLRKFWELQVYSIMANSGLVDEHPFKTRPHEWILPIKSLGFWNDGTKARIMLMGNFVAWTVGTFGVFVFAVRYPKDLFREHRGLIPLRNQDPFYRRYGHKMVFLFGGYLIHYLPFYVMGRSLYLHHYLPGFMFSALVLAGQFDALSRTWNPRLRVALAALLMAGAIFAFFYLSPLVYGTEIEAELLQKRKFIKAWNWGV